MAKRTLMFISSTATVECAFASSHTTANGCDGCMMQLQAWCPQRLLGGYIPFSSVCEQQSDKISIQSALWQRQPAAAQVSQRCWIVWCQIQRHQQPMLVGGSASCPQAQLSCLDKPSNAAAPATRHHSSHAPAPLRASNATTRPSSLDTRKHVGCEGFHVSASTSADMLHDSALPSGCRTSACVTGQQQW